MSERLDTLKKARERMLEDRDAHAKVLAAPFDRDKAERARAKFVEIQNLIDALDRAIRGEYVDRAKRRSAMPSPSESPEGEPEDDFASQKLRCRSSTFITCRFRRKYLRSRFDRATH